MTATKPVFLTVKQGRADSAPTAAPKNKKPAKKTNKADDKLRAEFAKHVQANRFVN